MTVRLIPNSITILVALLLLCFISSTCAVSFSFGRSAKKEADTTTSSQPQVPNDPDAEFALAELKKLSETGVYDSLSIKNIKNEGSRDGIFHINTMITLELASPYFKSGLESEEFRFIVMKHKFENITTLAVDEFPVMREDAIEEYYIKMVKERRKKRKQAFAELIGEAEASP